jgi:hypothetical protein
MERKILCLSIPKEEFEKINRARLKDQRTISSFFCIAGIERAEEVLRNVE